MSDTRSRGWPTNSGVRPGETHFVTIRLYDAISVEVLRRWQEDSQHRVTDQQIKLRRSMTVPELRQLARRARGRLEKLLDLGEGCCALSIPDAAAAVAETLIALESASVRIHSWVVMPNHAHAMVTLPIGESIDRFATQWRSISAPRLYRLTGIMTPWHADAITETVTGPSRFRDFHEYVQSNPERAGLRVWSWVGGDGVPPVSIIERWQASNAGNA